MIATLVSSGKATLHELDTVYGIQDAHDLLEILLVDAANQKIINKSAENTHR